MAKWRPLNCAPLIGGTPYGCGATEVEPRWISNPATPSTKAGAPYAAVMATGGHSVRFQYDYSHDLAGTPGTVSPSNPRWLRLVRRGGALTAYDSTNGSSWREIGSTALTGLPNTVDIGLFLTSPVTYAQSSQGNATQATARCDHVSVQGRTTTVAWQPTSVGGGNNFYPTLGFGIARRIDGTFVITGTGDIAPGVLAGIIAQNPATGQTIIGILVGLIVLIVIATVFVTAEYRRRLIRTTFTAMPNRGRVLSAKAIVIFAVALLTESVAAAISIPISRHLLISNGNFLFPVGALTAAREVFGSAILVASSPLVSYPYTVQNGYYPLGAWVSLIVPCCYAALALGEAAIVLRRRDP